MLTWLNPNPKRGHNVRKGKGMLAKGRVSRDYANGMITLGESEIRA